MSPLARLCSARGCTTIITTGTRCPTHHQHWARTDNQRRNTRPHRAIYNTNRWRRTRQAVLQRDGHQCQLCGDHATIADHHPTPLLQTSDPYDMQNLRSLCPPCSGKADAARARGRQFQEAKKIIDQTEFRTDTGSVAFIT